MEDKNQVIEQIIDEVVKIVEPVDKQKVQQKKNQLKEMNIDDVTDFILCALLNNVRNGKIKQEDAVNIASTHLTKLNPKYPTKEMLLTRLRWLESMNMTNMSMPLTVNHKLVLESFDKITMYANLIIDDDKSFGV